MAIATLQRVHDFKCNFVVRSKIGGLVAEKTDEQLFRIDTQSATPSTDLPTKPHSKEKKLRSLASLEPDARIPAISKTVQSEVRKQKESVTRFTSKKFLTGREQRKQAIKQRDSQRAKLSQIQSPTYDLWGPADNRLSADTAEEHYAVVTKKKRVKAPAKLQLKPSALPAVELPHPGSSYNPAFDEHQELLHKVVTTHVKETVEEDKLQKKMTPNYGSEGPPTAESKLKELSQGLGVTNAQDSDLESDGIPDRISVNPPTKVKIKTRAQRNKQLRLQQQESLRKKAKDLKQLEDRNKTDRLKVIEREIRMEEQKAANRQALRAAKRASLPYTTRRLHRNRFEAPEVDVALTEELTGNLRTSKSKNTLLEDRYKSLQKRNIIAPPGVDKHTHRRKVKHVEKKPFKEITSSSRAGGGIVVPHV